MSFEPRRNLRPRVATRSKWAQINALLRRSGSITTEDVGPWRVGYRIVRGRQ